MVTLPEIYHQGSAPDPHQLKQSTLHIPRGPQKDMHSARSPVLRVLSNTKPFASGKKVKSNSHSKNLTEVAYVLTPYHHSSLFQNRPKNDKRKRSPEPDKPGSVKLSDKFSRTIMLSEEFCSHTNHYRTISKYQATAGSHPSCSTPSATHTTIQKKKNLPHLRIPTRPRPIFQIWRHGSGHWTSWDTKVHEPEILRKSIQLFRLTQLGFPITSSLGRDQQSRRFQSTDHQSQVIHQNGFMRPYQKWASHLVL